MSNLDTQEYSTFFNPSLVILEFFVYILKMTTTKLAQM